MSLELELNKEQSQAKDMGGGKLSSGPGQLDEIKTRGSASLSATNVSALQPT